jgi:hypothetical protein
MAGIAQLELGNSQWPLSERLLVLIIDIPPTPANQLQTKNPLDLAAVPPRR